MCSIRHIFLPKVSNDLFVTAQFEKKVSLWSFKKLKKICEIETNLDFGGDRLSLVPNNNLSIIVTGAYTEFGVCGYNLKGERLWERKDLKKLQNITLLKLNGENCIGVGFDIKSYQILNASTGETIKKMRGIRNVYPNLDNTLWITKSDTKIKLVNPITDKEYWKKDLQVYSVGYSANKMLINTISKLIQFDTTGKEYWVYKCPDDYVIYDVCWDEKRKHWLFILYDHINGEYAYLCRIDEKGILISKEEIATAENYSFSADGQILLSSNGEIIDPSDLSVMWNFIGENEEVDC